jgi:hypothetical protein
MIRCGRTLKAFGFVILAAILGVATSSAQQAKSEAAVVTEAFTIVGIDQTNRIVMLKDKEGNVDSVVCGPGVQRFSELKVGDTVTFRYHESIVYAIQKPGTAPASSADAKASITRNTGAKPGGTIAQQLTATVTIQAIDMAIPSVTIKKDDGSTSSFKVENKKNLEGYKVGDRVLITYTQALAVSVEPGK